MKHWALKHIGSDYFQVGTCRGLVQICCHERFGDELPWMSDEGQIRKAAKQGGWKRVRGSDPIAVCAADDIAVMIDQRGFRHVGFVVDDGAGSLGLLHAFGTPEKGGSVVFDPWPEAKARGLHNFEFWRHATRFSHAYSPAV